MKSNFDWKAYVNNYLDLKEAGIDNEEKALNHWENYGKFENRTWIPKLNIIKHIDNSIFKDLTIEEDKINFNWKNYIDRYSDLLDAGITDQESAWNHWNKYGKREGRNYSDKKIKYNKKNVITIVTSPIIESIAINFSNFFKEFNIYTKIIYDLSEERCKQSSIDDIFLIIHNDAAHELLPKTFILYQAEQATSDFFNKKYLNELNKSFSIWEFSIKNKIKYDKINLNKIFCQPMPFYYLNINTENKNTENKNTINNSIFDIGFYGAQNERRYKILNNISSFFNTNIGFGKIGEERNKIINESKIILNLHYYKECGIESCRLNEILQYDKVIISELPDIKDWYNKNLYDNLVIFIDEIKDDFSNINKLIEKIKFYLIPENYEKQINIMKKLKANLHNKCKFSISKNLLTHRNILDFNKNKFEFELNKDQLYCLHLLETPYRIEEFKKQKYIPQFTIFPAVKYSPGWMGTSYSYTNIIWNAKRCGLKSITVFEDDCHFKSDFNEKYKIFKEFLDKIPKWDIFVGVIANLPPETNVINVYKYKDITFVELDRMLSMVFNIYNKSSYDSILKWDEKNTDVHTNTIDQFLKNKHLSIITTYPFEFECTNTDSTLWGTNLFNEYNKLFKLSLDSLKNKIENFSGKIIKIK